MTDLTMRAEQAVLGALLTAGAKNGELDGIRPRDFADKRHQAIFAALTDAVPQAGGLLGKFRMWLTGLPFWPQVRDFRQYIAELPGTCPDTAHLSSYAQMVTEASQQRRAADASAVQDKDAPDHGRIAGAAAYLARETERAAASRRWPSRGPHTTTTGTTLTRDTAIAARAIPQNQEPAAARATQPQVQAQSAGKQAEALSAEKLEEHVLADILRRPGQAEEIIIWLPVEVFTSETRREIYRDIRHRLQQGEPIDPLIVAWDINGAGGHQGDQNSEALDPAYVLRIAAIDAAPGTAAIIGRALLADQVCTRQLGADWPQSLRRTRPTPTTPVTTPEPGPEVSQQQPQAKLPQPVAPAGPQADPAAMEPPPAIPEAAGPVQRM